MTNNDSTRYSDEQQYAMLTYELIMGTVRIFTTLALTATINVTSDPDPKTQIFEEQLNTFTCSNCNEIYTLDSPILYHDMDRNIAVQYLPESSIGDDEAIAAFVAPEKEELLESLEQVASYLAHPHVVFAFAELQRYVRFMERVHEEKMNKDQMGR